MCGGDAGMMGWEAGGGCGEDGGWDAGGCEGMWGGWRGMPQAAATCTPRVLIKCTTQCYVCVLSWSWGGLGLPGLGEKKN